MSEQRYIAPHVQEKTFSTYNEKQGKAYAEVRRDHHPDVYKIVLDHHTSTGGQLDTLLDIGCGPGQVVRGLAPYFKHAIALDPAEGMITVGRSRGGVTSTSEPIRYEVSSAEELGTTLPDPVQDASVDLIVAANAAHWFDLSRFWPTAARILKPGGTVALLTAGPIVVDPTMPNALHVQYVMDEYAHNLGPYTTTGNLHARYRYLYLPLPWTLKTPVPEFDQSTFFRRDWRADENFYEGLQEVGMEVFEKLMSTNSSQTRWDAANPDLVGTDRDPMKIARRDVERLLHEAGVEKGKERVRGRALGAGLFVKKNEA